MQNNNRDKSGKISAFIGGAIFTGLIAVVGLLLQFVQIGQTEYHEYSDNSISETMVYLSEQQVKNLQELGTLQANNSGGSQAKETEAAQKIVELQNTLEAINIASEQIKSTATAEAIIRESLSNLSPLCSGAEPLTFHEGLPNSDPCNGIVGSAIVPWVWVIVEPETNNGREKGKCLFNYATDSTEGIYDGSMWALFRSNASDNALPSCPITQ